jgi:hypothetical protein
MMKKTNINQEKQSEKKDKQQLEEDLLEEMGRNIETCLEFRLCGNAMFKMFKELGFWELKLTLLASNFLHFSNL